MNAPLASVIIPTRERPALVAAAVESVLQGQTQPAEVVVVDQSHAPHPTLSTHAPGDCAVHYVWSPSRGASRARNAGIAAARHDLLLFIDDDILATPTWFGTLVTALVEVGPRGVVTGRVLPTSGPPGTFAPSTKAEEQFAVFAGRVGQDVLYSNNMALYRSAIESVGGFDEHLGPGARFPNAEDNDLGFRLLEADYRIVYEPRATVLHSAWRQRRDYLPLQWNYGSGQGAYYAKHLDMHDRYMLGRFTRHVLRHAVRAVRLAYRRPLVACGEAVYVVGVLTGAADWLLAQPDRAPLARASH